MCFGAGIVQDAINGYDDGYEQSQTQQLRSTPCSSVRLQGACETPLTDLLLHVALHVGGVREAHQEASDRGGTASRGAAAQPASQRILASDSHRMSDRVTPRRSMHMEHSPCHLPQAVSGHKPKPSLQ